MPTIQIELPVLHSAQLQIINSPARFKVLACGRRFGKTTVAADLLINDMLEGYPVAYCAPSYKMVQEVWRVIKRISKPITRYSNETEKRIELVTGGSLDMWSLESPDSVRGRSYYRLVVDEAAYVRGLLHIWERALSPLLTDYQGRALFPSTPQGYNDFFKLFQRGVLKEEFWASWQFPTSANPHIPIGEIELQKRTLPTRSFSQEYEAKFEEDAGAIYDNFSVAEGGNVTKDAEYNPDLPIWWGVDDGYVFGDGIGSLSYHPRVFLLGQRTPQGGMNIFAEYVACGEVEEISLQNVIQMGYPKPELALVDSSAAQLKARIWALGIQTMGATHKVNEGIKNVRRLICDGQGQRLYRVHPRCKHTIREHQTYRFDLNTNVSGEPKPLKIDDHTCDAGRYLCHPLRF